MPYISNTGTERQLMLKKIGVSSFEELIAAIPAKMRMSGPLKLDDPLSELEITRKIKSQTCGDLCTSTANSFLGAGVYDHFIPAAVDTIVSRPEFFTAYTPYQAEVSQGTLQFIYEYQTMICELTGMEIANASMYDGASAIAEAILMAVRKNRLTKAILPATLHPEYEKVIRIYTEGLGIELLTAPMKDGLTDLEALKAMMDETIGSVVLQNPNFFGNIEAGEAIGQIAHSNPKTLFIVAADPISLALLKAPAAYGADIAVGEGQALGNSMYMGGPLFGYFSTKLDLARQMPGRIVGGTLDREGKRAYALTLQAREQHIRREKAVSNICSNQGLVMLQTTIYLEALGKSGLAAVAELCWNKAHWAATQIAAVPGFSVAEGTFFKEFVVKTPVPAALIVDKLERRGVVPGLALSRYYPARTHELLVCVPEMNTKAQIELLAQSLKEAAR